MKADTGDGMLNSIDVDLDTITQVVIMVPRIFKHHHNSYLFASDAEVNEGPSMTVPNQAMSMATLYQRFARGQKIDGREDAVFYGDVDVPDFEHMDPADKETYIALRKEEQSRIKSQLKDAETAYDDKRKSLKKKPKAEFLDFDQGDKDAAKAGTKPPYPDEASPGPAESPKAGGEKPGR